ncbi:probable leucine-rich repeat receptor-like protein kinase At1g35710, partial [Amborella trichopoda]
MGALCSHKKSLASCLFLMSSVINIFFWVGCSCLERERAALLAFKASFLNQIYAYEQLSLSWEGTDCCGWLRVTCGKEGQVVGLGLHALGVLDINLTSLLRLEGLQFLDLSDNNLRGSLFIKELYRLKKLQTLDLSYNSFEGAMPVEIGLQSSSLEVLYLSSNQLGSLPSSLGNLSHLKELDLSHNELNGIIPPLLGSLSSLEELYLSENEFRGGLSRFLGNLSFLHLVYIDHNNLSEAIPPELSKLRNLQFLDLS